MKKTIAVWGCLAVLGACAQEPVWRMDAPKRFSGSEKVQIETGFLPKTFGAFSISAWVTPDKLDGFHEIFRTESGENRILFSFQERGRVLALGLNVGGKYQECDARIDPAALLDGSLHYVVGTFDGVQMRVYLDGTKIGELKHEGTAVSSGTSGWIGSTAGVREPFFGEIAELSIFTRTLTEAEIRDVFRTVTARTVKIDALPENWRPVFDEKLSFEEGVLMARRLADGKPLPGLRQALGKIYASRHAERWQRFTRFYKRSPVDFMLGGNGFQDGIEAKLALLTEYMPITDEQWLRCTREERTHWQEMKNLSKILSDKLAAVAPDTAVLLAPELTWPTVPERPTEREAVAPYKKAETPAPKQYATEEMARMIEADWLFQTGGKPDVAGELERTRKLFKRLKVDTAALDAIPIPGVDAQATYFQIRRLKRAALLKTLDFNEILAVDMQFPAGNEWPHETRHRLGYMAQPGAQLVVLDINSGKVRRLMPQAPLHGSFWRADVSYDGKRVLFCFKPHNEKSFHIYEINADGSGLRQLTSGVYDDLDPVYLPDGKHYIFSSTRGHTYVRCMPPTNAFMLSRGGLEEGDEDIFIISANNEPDYLPVVMPDGRILYTRWEYTDKPLWRAQSLWTVNPDGTRPTTLWGNQSVWPDLVKDARVIPGTRRVMFTGCGHHNWFAGCIGIIDPEKGLNFPEGLTKVTQELEWPESHNGPVDPKETEDYTPCSALGAYQTPYPLSANEFLASARKDGKFSLYLMDLNGNRELLYEGNNNIFHAMPLAARPVPPVIPDRVEWPTRATKDSPADGTIYSGNVYRGAPPELKGKAKFLRILHIEQKTYTYWNKRPALSTGPVVSLVQSDGVKRILGTVPINADGSVWFRVPSGVALHFQLLDENHGALQTMRSFVNVMPGESRGCLGCHEQHLGAPPADRPNSTVYSIVPVPWAYDSGFAFAPDTCRTLEDAVNAAAGKAASASPELKASVHRFGTSVSYLKDVQPVLDKYCGACHQGNGKAVKTLDLTLRGYHPYTLLIGHPGWGRPNTNDYSKVPGYDLAGTLKIENYSWFDPAAYATPKPMTRLSYTSRLVAILAGGKHQGVKADPYSLMRVTLWVDAMCPFTEDSEIRKEDDPQFQGSDWIALKPKIKTAPVLVRPGPFPAHDDGAK